MRPYPPRHSGVAPLFELGIRREAVPHDVRRVVLVPQLRTALEQEVYNEELYAAIQACKDRGGEVSGRKIILIFGGPICFTFMFLDKL